MDGDFAFITGDVKPMLMKVAEVFDWEAMCL